MAEILPGVHQVEGVDPSPDFSTHVYLVKDRSDKYALIDTGLPDAPKAIEAYLAKHRISPSQVQTILLTHLHLDHVGGLRAMKALTHATVYSHWLEAAFIAKDPFKVDVAFKDGETLNVLGGAVAYHTPGHTPGHTAYHLPDRGLLFSGDLFFGVGEKLVLTTPEYTHHIPSAKVSARRVATLKFDSLLSYHGGPILKGGLSAVRETVSRL